MLKKYTIVFFLLLSPLTQVWGEQVETANTIYNVVINHEEQYSIWPKSRKVPSGWKAIGKSGTKQQCLDYIKDISPDMRPIVLYKKMKLKTKNN